MTLNMNMDYYMLYYPPPQPTRESNFHSISLYN